MPVKTKTNTNPNIMKLISTFFVLIINTVFTTTCIAQDTSEYNPQEEIGKIQQLSQRFGKAYQTSNADSLASLFAEDANYATNNGFLLEGREEIRQTFSRWMQEPSSELVDGPDSWMADFQINGNMAYSLSYYNQQLFPNETDTLLQKGYGLTVFERQENGSWKIKAMAVNKHPETEAPTDD